MKDETIGERLKRLREAAGMSQPQLAEKAAVPVASLRGWEQDRREPLLKVSSKLADALGVSLDVLAGRAAVAEIPATPPAPTPEPPAEEPLRVAGIADLQQAMAEGRKPPKKKPSPVKRKKK